MIRMLISSCALTVVAFFGVKDARAQDLTPAETFNQMSRIILKASNDVASSGHSNEFASVNISVRWPEIKAGLAKDELPVQISSFLDSEDISFFTKDTVRSTLRFTNPGSYCKSIMRSREQVRTNFDEYRPAPIVFTATKWSFTYSDILDCSDDHTEVLKGNFKPPFLQIPIALYGVVLLTSEEDTLPAWITRQHIAVASLSYLPKNNEKLFSPLGHYTKSSECVPYKQQPNLLDIQNSINSAECTTVDTLGRRKIGSYPRNWIPDHLNRYHQSSAQRDLSKLFFFFEGNPNNVSNWSYIDKGIKDMPISISIFDEPNDVRTPFYDGSALEFLCKTGVRPDNEASIYSWEELFRIYIAASACNWRSEASFITGDSFLRDKHSVALGSFGTYMRMIEQEKFLAQSSTPWSTERGSPTLSKYSKWKADVLSGNYPLMDIVWMYMDPASLKERKVREYVASILNGRTSSSYKGSLALWGWLMKVR